MSATRRTTARRRMITVIREFRARRAGDTPTELPDHDDQGVTNAL